jgi:lipopolysaccharide biosynthesis glycosyltransferase
VLYHDIDALAVGDVGELYDLDVSGAPLAARDAVERKGRYGFRTVWAATVRMRENPAAADDYLHRMANHLTHDFRCFNAGIMLLNLDVMRRDGFKDNYLPWASMYGLNDQQLLNCYAGNRRVELDQRWNAMPAQEVVSEPRLIHWAGHAKPWDDGFIALKDRWLAAEERVAMRART